jgi:hypothetical protein
MPENGPSGLKGSVILKGSHMSAYIERICRLCDHYGYRRVGAPLGFCRFDEERKTVEAEQEACPSWKPKQQHPWNA